MEEVGEHPDAPLLDLRGLRVFGVVDEVPVQVLTDQLGDVRTHPGGDEGGEVPLGVAVEEELLLDQVLGVHRIHRVLRDPVIGGGLADEATAPEH
ncbi:MAG TPA: hypothetical protein VIZ61_10240 [Solirubrobacterales bacterium]